MTENAAFETFVLAAFRDRPRHRASALQVQAFTLAVIALAWPFVPSSWCSSPSYAVADAALAFLLGSSSDAGTERFRVWQLEFPNRSLAAVGALRPHAGAILPGHSASVGSVTGRIESDTGAERRFYLLPVRPRRRRVGRVQPRAAALTASGSGSASCSCR